MAVLFHCQPELASDFDGESGYFAGELLAAAVNTRFQSGRRLALSAVVPQLTAYMV